MVVTNGTKETIKVKSISEGKQILYDIQAVLLETHQMIKNGLNSNNKSELQRLSSRVLATLKGVKKIDEVLDTVLRCDGNHFVSTRLASIEKANNNMKRKLAERTPTKSSRGGKISASYMSLKQLECSSNKNKVIVTPQSIRTRPSKKLKSELTQIEQLLAYEKPVVEGKRYSICQLIQLLKNDEASPVFQPPSVKAIVTQLQVSGQCAITYNTFTRHARKYKDTGFLPDNLDEGLREGRPNRVGGAQLGVLQQKVIEQCGVLQHPKKNLSTDILNMEKEKGVITKGPPSNATLKLCLQQCAAAEGVSVVRESSARPQGARRQMAGRSSRNCMSQICNLILSNFTPGKYKVPSNLPEGCKLAHKIAEQVAGIPMKPIKPWQIINHDMTSMYVWNGSEQDENKVACNAWCLVSTASQEKGSRKRSSAIVASEKTMCNGLTVKWDEGAAASGHVFPMVAIFSGFSKEEMPRDPFIVVEVKGMCMNSHTDIRFKEKGYVVLLRSKEKMDQYFDWYDTTVLYPYYRQLLEEYCGIPADQETEFDEEFHARVFVDSDMQQIAQLLQLAIMERNHRLGLQYNKIGAKTTMNFQPMDLGKFFKIIKYKTRTVTTDGTNCPLRKVMQAGCKTLHDDGRLMLSEKKRLAIIDCVSSSPQVKGAAYSSESVKASFIHCGFINSIDACPDIYAVMKASDVSFATNSNLQTLFLQHIHDCTLQMKESTIGIPEKFFQSLQFPIDKDLSGNEWPLSDKAAIVFRRAQPLTSLRYIQQKQALVVKNLEERRQQRTQQLYTAQQVLLTNDKCVEELLKVGGYTPSSDPCQIKDMDLDLICQIKSSVLECFVRVRSQKDLTQKWKCPAKGNVKKVQNKLFCCLTRQPFLIEQVKTLAASPVIGVVPILPPMEIPVLTTAEPSIVCFGDRVKLKRFNATTQWCLDAVSAVESVKTSNRYEGLMLDLNTFNERSSVFSKKIRTRLPYFLSSRLPADKPELMLGLHWHWNSFITKLPKIAALAALSGHICRGVQYRMAHESLLEYEAGTFLEVSSDNKHWDGAYAGMDMNRGEINRIGASHVGIGIRWETGHARYARRENAISKIRQQAIDYPNKDAAGLGDGRRGTFDDLKQLCCLGMDRSKIDAIINLFEWSEEENQQLKKLNWRGVALEDNLKNRQYKHLTYLFELAYTIAITPGQNRTSNPTGEWELGYWGE